MKTQDEFAFSVSAGHGDEEAGRRLEVACRACGDKGSDDEGADKEDKKEGDADNQSATKKEDEDGSVATNNNSLLGGEGGPAESVKKTSMMEKLAS